MKQISPPLFFSPLACSLVCLLAVLCLTGCTSETAASLEGKWSMHQVLREGVDVSSEHNPYGERYIVLGADRHYTSDGRPYGANTGNYRFDSEALTLSLDSDVGPEDDSRWVVKLGQDTMRWQGTGTAWAEQFEIIYLRIN